ncbi:MAG: DUF91 domain-containing protein [Candidatus Omnitrophica bacterium]|nr:DUF91 domain-containing protein [Candidatus Omnitrophota bacterium]
MGTVWKVTCEEVVYPGLWQLWFKHQCVAVGWPPGNGYKLHDKTKKSFGWSRARKAVKDMAVGDMVIVALRGNCVGRIGEITGIAIEDNEWDPLVPKDLKHPFGEKGRRIFVRWDLTTGPYDNDLIIKLPKDCRFTSSEFRPTAARVKSHSLDQIKKAMNDPKNWIGLLGKFSEEQALSDYISSYPNYLEDGLCPHPNSPRIREFVFKDKTRLDVLLMDRNKQPVIVECKQNSPVEEDIIQLRGYIKNLKQRDPNANQNIRGILVHGGAQKLTKDVISLAKKKPQVEIVSYRMRVDFAPCL